MPPSLYRPLPGWLKRTVFLDLPTYKFDENKDGKEAIQEEERRRRSEDA